MGSWRHFRTKVLNSDRYRLILFVIIVSAAVVAGITVARLQTPTSPLSAWDEVDSEIYQDVETVLAWDGVCDLSDPVRRAQIQAGHRVLHAEAIACLVPQDVFEGGWQRRSEKEKVALLELLSAHYVLSGDERVLELDVCGIRPDPRGRAHFNISQEFYRIGIQPFHYALQQPDAIEEGEALRRFFDCPDWSLEQRMSAAD